MEAGENASLWWEKLIFFKADIKRRLKRKEASGGKRGESARVLVFTEGISVKPAPGVREVLSVFLA